MWIKINTLSTFCGLLQTLREYLHRVFTGKSHRHLMISIGSLAGSGLMSVGIRFIGSIVQGRFVGPETLGYYNKFTILPNYLLFLDLGVFTALSQQYPYYMGKGERDMALRYASSALGWTYLLCIFYGAFFLIPCLWAAGHGHWRAALGWGTQSILTTTSVYMLYLATCYRNNHKFVTWSKTSVISSITSLLFLPLVAVYNFVGICVRYSLPETVSMLYAHWKRPIKTRPLLDYGILKKMITFGVPLMVFSYIYSSFWDATTYTYILKMSDSKSLGLFAFAVTLSAVLRTVSLSISQVFHPHISSLYGSSGKSMAVTFHYSIKCSLVGLVILLPLIGLACLFIGPIVRWLLPKYIECIPIARWLFWLSLVHVIDFPYILLFLGNRGKEYAVSIVTSFLLFVAILVFFALSGSGANLQHIVIAFVACKLVAIIGINCFAWRAVRLESRLQRS